MSRSATAALAALAVLLSACGEHPRPLKPTIQRPEPPADGGPVLQIDFEDPEDKHTKRLADHKSLKIVKRAGVNRSAALRATYEPYERGSRRMVRRLALPPSLEYTLQFDVRFSRNFDFRRGGKLHGLGPDRAITCLLYTSDAADE